MAVKIKVGSSFSIVSTHVSSSFQRKSSFKLRSRIRMFGSKQSGAANFEIGAKSCQLIHGKLAMDELLPKRRLLPSASSEEKQSYSEIELDDTEQERQQPSTEGAASSCTSYLRIERVGGKPGFISFYGHTHRNDEEFLVSSPSKNKDYLLWFVGPAVLVASFIFPSLYLRRIISTIFEDSLLTDFLILFFTEALFYCGVAVFLVLLDCLQGPKERVSAAKKPNLSPHLGYRISSVAILVLSLIIPMATMGLVWPWTGPAASATLAPYLVGIIVQFAFEQYARRESSRSWPAIPIIFQVYRLHQLNRAAQLVTALSFTVRGAEMTAHNVAINGSLTTLLHVLQFLGIICIWSLSSFIMRYFPSASLPQP